MTMQAKLDELRALPSETEWVEFKQNNDTPDEIGSYISALANGAALHQKPFGYLVWGVEDQTHRVVGTTVRLKQQRIGGDELENWLLRMLAPRIDFRFHDTVVMVEVPAATSQPVRFQHVAYVRVGSIKKKLAEFPEKERKLWHLQQDWSAKVVEGATIGDLDDEAIAFARTQFKKKNPRLADEPSWDTSTFLNKAKVCIGGKVTRTALLLLGKSESDHFLSPSHAQVTWVLRDAKNVELDHDHFGMPLIMVGDEVLKKVRNLTVRYLPDGTLFPEEVTQYDPWVVRETLHNCIAHQDYEAHARINVVETESSLLFTNRGAFIPGTVEQMIEADAPPEIYRNRFLTQAMVNLNMIETIGSGIKRMFRVQRERSFPLPDYDLSTPDRVVVRLSGRIIDENYTQLLLRNSELDLIDVMALDKVQKKQPIDEDTAQRLRTRGLIEGRRPNVFVSAKVAAATDAKAAFIKNRAFDKDHYKAMVVAYLQKFGDASLDDFRKLLLSKLSDALSQGQKERFISNLLQGMRLSGTIVSSGPRQKTRWALSRSPTSNAARDESGEG